MSYTTPWYHRVKFLLYSWLTNLGWALQGDSASDCRSDQAWHPAAVGTQVCFVGIHSVAQADRISSFLKHVFPMEEVKCSQKVK